MVSESTFILEESKESVKTVKDRLLILQNLLGFKRMQSFAEWVGINPNTYKGSMRTGKISHKTLTRIIDRVEQHTGVNVREWLEFKTDVKPNLVSEDTFDVSLLNSGAYDLANIDRYIQKIKLNSIVFLPKVNVSLLISTQTLMDQFVPTEWYVFPYELIMSLSNIYSLYVITVQDQLMFPILKKDDVVLIDISKQDVESGNIYAFVIGKALCISELEIDGEKVILRPHNALYKIDPPWTFLLKDVRIIGKCVWYGRVLS